MLAKAETVALIGTAGHPIQVEVHVAQGGIPTFKIVGLPTASVREADQRIRSAIEGLPRSDYHWPNNRIVANLAPGNLRKEGTHFDLVLALCALAGGKQISAEALEGWMIVGELGLDGAVRPVRGVMAAAMSAKEHFNKGIICPEDNAAEAAIVEGLTVVPVRTLKQAIEFLKGDWDPPAVLPAPEAPLITEDMSEVKGHSEAKKAAEIACAGGHNLLMIGPPGSGKSMIASRLPGILPAMSFQESLDVTSVYSVAGQLGNKAGLMRRRPFRSPHQGVSLAGLIGGGSGLPRPGEVSLAHHGVLFLDEITLFRSDALDSLRGPLEDGKVRIARSGATIEYPCSFSLVAAMNPCPCGYLGDTLRSCRCTGARLRYYNEKLSGPLIDRFDIQAMMARPTRVELMSSEPSEPSAAIRARVEAAREVQRERYDSSLILNSSCCKADLEKNVRLTSEASSLLGALIDALGLTGRGVDRIKRLARTVADLEGSESIEEEHIGVASGHRYLEAEAVPA